MKKLIKKINVLWYSHPRMAIALMLIAVNLVVILLFTVALTLLSDKNFFDSLAYLFTYTLSSDDIYGFVAGDDNFICFILKLVLAIIQMVIFSGALIGFTTDLLQSTIDQRLNNTGKISLNNHYVFLNWSSIGPNLIYDLSFLEGKKNIVILSELEREDVLNSIQNVFIENKRKIKNIRLFIKTGDPNSSKHLSDISLASAKYIGLLLKNVDDNEVHSGMPSKDIDALKTLFAIMNIGANANIVVETENNKTVNKIEQLFNKIDPNMNRRIIAFSHNEIIGNILGKTLINSHYSMLFHDLLSYEGCEFYGIPVMDIDEALALYNDCIPVVNYDDDCEIDENGIKQKDQLYILSDDRESLGIRKEKKVFDRRIKFINNIERTDFTIFILSDTDKHLCVVEELNRYNYLNNTNIKYEVFDYEDGVDTLKEKIKETSGLKKILLLSAEDSDGNNQDTNIFLAALSLKTEKYIDENIEIFAEIVNPGNLNSLQNLGIISVIVSNKIISLAMVQLLTHPGSKRFYRDMISTNGDDEDDGIDFEIIKASNLFEIEDKLVFSSKAEMVQVMYNSTNKSMMCIGVIFKNSDEILFLCDKMDEEVEIIINKDDELVIVEY